MRLFWFAMLLSAGSGTSRAQGVAPAPKELPAALVMPLRTLGIGSEELAAARPALEAAAAQLANGFLQGPRPLPEIEPTSPRLTVNFRRRAQKIITGTPKNAATEIPSAAVEATWCSVMDRDVLFVTVADARSNQLLASRHVAFAKGAVKNALPQLPGLLQAAWTAARARARTPKSDNLNVGLYQSEDSTRRDEGSGFCTGQLLEERLAPDFTVARALGHDLLAMARDLLELPARLQRPTRGVLLSFRQPNQLKPLRKLPVTLDLQTRFSETVFGQHLAIEPKSSSVKMAAAGTTLELSGIEALKKTLDAEKATLLLADQPQAAKIDRAWVYLDRGRAYGLKMNDRVVAEVDGQPVKGHVVKFFGPELKLKSPRGYAIHEGAIVYVRKGQKLAKVGTAFTPDPRTYPTPYPIPAGK